MQTQPNMSEQDLLNDLLNQEKQMMSSYATFIQEASCENLRKVLTNHFNQTSLDQYQVFDQMRQKGYYQPKDADARDVQKAKDNFRNVQSGL